MKTIFFDVDTQNDFMNQDGALYVPGAELLKPKLKQLTDFAKLKNIPVLGDVDRHFGTEEYKNREQELARNGGPFPYHCMIDTQGERKIRETIFYPLRGREADETNHGRYGEENIYIPHILESKEMYDYINFVTTVRWTARELLEHTSEKKFIPRFFEKQNYDVFTNPAAEYVLKAGKVDEAIVYGVATEYCVKAAVLGMQQRGIQTYVLTDAIKGITPQGEKSALEEMTSSGAILTTTKEIYKMLEARK